MPKNPRTGKADRRTLSQAELLEYRLNQRQAEVRKGKKRAANSPEGGETDASGQAPSPLDPLANLVTLNLDSGGSNSANTPADSPTAAPQPNLPERLAPTPPSPPQTRDAVRSSGKSASNLPAAALT
jgi:hypothetical protein